MLTPTILFFLSSQSPIWEEGEGKKRRRRKSDTDRGADGVSEEGGDEDYEDYENDEDGYLPDWTRPKAKAEEVEFSDDEFIPMGQDNHPNRDNRTKREEDILAGKFMRGEGKEPIFVDRDEADPDEVPDPLLRKS